MSVNVNKKIIKISSFKDTGHIGKCQGPVFSLGESQPDPDFSSEKLAEEVFKVKENTRIELISDDLEISIKSVAKELIKIYANSID